MPPEIEPGDGDPGDVDPAESEEKSPESDPGHRGDRWIRPYFEDSALWPLLIVAFVIAVTIASAVLLLAFGDRNPFALAALLGLGWMSADTVWGDLRHRRLGLVSGLILSIWLFAGVATLAAIRTGLF